MTTAYTMMTALPPTTGHRDLIAFASNLADRVVVIFCTQDGEPYQDERDAALNAVAPDNVKILRLHSTREDVPNDGFREYWAGILIGAGIRPGDYVVTSELYGKWLAELVGARWMPYDVARDINPAKASRIRLIGTKILWPQILPEFRPHVQLRVTIFGAESTGKTTLAQQLSIDASTALQCGAHFLPEYARPYLEQVGNEITTESMTAIFEGQRAQQRQHLVDHPVIIQDTDLYSTLGYWGMLSDMEHPRLSGPPPASYLLDAKKLESDLYLITPSNIPFEPDPLRYGGDHREIEDWRWINFCNRNHLPFELLDGDPAYRFAEAKAHIYAMLENKSATLNYERPYQ